MMVKHGDRGQPVQLLQESLADAGFRLNVDGWFGANTDAALRQFQRMQGLVVDGIAGPKTWAALDAGSDYPALRQLDLVLAADYLRVPLAAVMAVNEVESRGTGFLNDRRPVILFERHIMRRRLIHHGINPVPYQLDKPYLVNDKPGGYVGGTGEHDRLELAAEIHEAAAIESCSWGLFQIMGFHWRHLGYPSAQAFAIFMCEDESAQLDAFVRFIERDGALHAALKRQDWRDFARRYNGPAFERNDYDTRLAAAYRRHARALEHAA